MTALATATEPQTTEVSTRTRRLRRFGLVAGMLLAPWGFLVTNLTYALAIRDGGSDESGVEALKLAAAHPTMLRIGLVGGMLACLLMVPAVLGAFRLARTSRLAVVGGSLMILGYVCYFGVLISSFTILAMAERGGPIADYAAVIDAGEGNLWTAWVFLLFVIGNIVGTTLFAVGLLRSRAVPVWAALGIMSWPPLHVIGLVFFGNEVPQVIGAVLQGLGFAAAAVTLIRTRDSV